MLVNLAYTAYAILIPALNILNIGGNPPGLYLSKA